MSNEIDLKISLNRPQYPVLEGEQLAYVCLEIAPTGFMPVAVGNSALNLALVLDRSGSMAGQKIYDLRVFLRRQQSDCSLLHVV